MLECKDLYLRGRFSELYDAQIEFQKEVVAEQSFDRDSFDFETIEEIKAKVVLPKDSIDYFSYHVVEIIEELGEVLKADKRRKTHRNSHYDPGEKKEELADVFISVLNLCIFSNLNAEEVYDLVEAKIKKNKENMI